MTKRKEERARVKPTIPREMTVTFHVYARNAELKIHERAIMTPGNRISHTHVAALSPDGLLNFSPDRRLHFSEEAISTL